MESILSAPVKIGGVVARTRDGGQEMADTPLIVVGAGLLGGGGWAFIQYLLDLKRRENKDKSEDIYKLLDAIKEDNTSLRAEVNALQDKQAKHTEQIEMQSKQIASLFTEKVTLEARVTFLVDQIAEKEAIIARLSERDMLSHIEIEALQAQVTKKTTELEMTRQRLEVVRLKFPDAINLYQTAKIDGSL